MAKAKVQRVKDRGLPANYGGATPRQVAEAVLKYRPGKPNGAKNQPQAKR